MLAKQILTGVSPPLFLISIASINIKVNDSVKLSSLSVCILFFIETNKIWHLYIVANLFHGVLDKSL